MEPASTAVRSYMHAPVHTLLETRPVTEAADELEAKGISALGVVDRQGAMVGVLSRTDLIRAGRVRPVRQARRRVLSLPPVSIRELMTSTVEIIAPDRPMYEAARCMRQRGLHRLFVSEDRRPIGVVSTKEMMRVVVDARAMRPISEVMHIAMISVEAQRPVAYAVDRMAATERTGVVITEDGWPVGVFTQADALAARDAPPDDRVDEWMDPRIISLPLATPLWRAAEQVVATRARRLLAVDGKGVRGVVTGMDFTRVVEAGE